MIIKSITDPEITFKKELFSNIDLMSCSMRLVYFSASFVFVFFFALTMTFKACNTS